MPAYNPRAEELVEAVDSVLGQTVADLELIVVDDGSDPPIAALLNNRQDRRLRIVRHTRNRGLSAARNTGWQAATGEIPADIKTMPRNDAWQRRILSGQAGGNMMQGMSAFGIQRALTMFSDWSERIAEGDV